MRLSNKRIIKDVLGSYHRALETLKHIYFINYDESDEYRSVKMFNRKMELVSDNNFAYESLLEDVEEGYVWISPKFEKLYKENFADSE